MYQIKNEHLNIRIKSKGAELSSLRTKEREYLWTGDSRYWNRQSPLLFPIIGSLKDDKTIIEGNTYYQSKHGFIRDLEFELRYQKENEIAFTNIYSKATLDVYPFKYRTNVIYILNGKNLKTIYQVINMDSHIMPFNIGAHPGFNCPLYLEDSFNSYSIHFEKPESFSSPKLEENGIINLKESARDYSNLQVLDLSHDIFDIDTIMILDVKSTWAALVNKKGKGLKIKFKDFSTFSIWSPGIKKAPFVCLEPWVGYPDRVDSDYDFFKKANLILLPPNETFEINYEIEIID
jgi:galactose mutarotase-like enzyme